MDSPQPERTTEDWVPRDVRPWLCPERERCHPLLNLRDGDYTDITVPEVGHSWTCWGRMEQPVTFVYDGVEHRNDHNCCHYTPLKGLIRWQENPEDWNMLASYYSLAFKKATNYVGDPRPIPPGRVTPDA